MMPPTAACAAAWHSEASKAGYGAPIGPDGRLDPGTPAAPVGALALAWALCLFVLKKGRGRGDGPWQLMGRASS